MPVKLNRNMAGWNDCQHKISVTLMRSLADLYQLALHHRNWRRLCLRLSAILNNFSNYRADAARECRPINFPNFGNMRKLAHCAAQFFVDFEVRPEIRGFSKSVEYFTQEWVSANRQFNRLANAAKHFHQRIDAELSRFLIHYIGDTWT